MDSCTKLAKDTIEYHFKTGKLLPLPLDLPKEIMAARAGVFVTLYKHGQLRGCIGTLQATTANIAEEIRQNALSSAFEDPRFDPLEQDELSELELSVDILNPAELIKDRSELDVKKYGVICQSGYKKGLLLPDIEGVDSVDVQIEIACQKAGINPVREKFNIYKFTVTRHD